MKLCEATGPMWGVTLDRAALLDATCQLLSLAALPLASHNSELLLLNPPNALVQVTRNPEGGCTAKQQAGKEKSTTLSHLALCPVLEDTRPK